MSAGLCSFVSRAVKKKTNGPPFLALRRTLSGCIVFHLHAVVLHNLNRGSGAGKHLNIAASEAQGSVRALVIGREREHKWNPLMCPLTDSSQSSTCGWFKLGVLRPRGPRSQGPSVNYHEIPKRRSPQAPQNPVLHEVGSTLIRVYLLILPHARPCMPVNVGAPMLRDPPTWESWWV